jgi:acyl-CoA thioester hydrolase
MRHEQPVREQFALIHPLRVRWAEVDAQGIVFNPQYFAYADVAMTEYMRSAGFAYPGGFSQFGCELFAVRAEADFLASARYDDELSLATRIEYIGRTSLRFRTAIFRSDELLTSTAITYVNASLESKQPMPVPAEIVARIERFERTPPERKR